MKIRTCLPENEILWILILLPQRVCCRQECAGLAQHVKASEQAQEDTSPRKINVTSKSPVGDISVVTLIRTDTTLDHSQKAEKVCITLDTYKDLKPKLSATHDQFDFWLAPQMCLM